MALLSKRTKKVLGGTTLTVLLAVAAFLAWVLWWPLPQGTPPLSPQMEALRPQAIDITELRPVALEDYTVIVTYVSVETVTVRFERSSAAEISIPVGSSTQTQGCTISVLESHPRRPKGNAPGSARSSALVTIQCQP